MSLVAQIYESAANAGLLKECLWYPSNGAPSQRHQVGFAAPDESLLDGLTLSLPPGRSAPEAARALFQQAVTASYDLRADDHALRQITKLPESAQAAAFRAYRDAYPVRRQLHGARLTLPPSTDPAADRLRAALTVLGAKQ